MVFSYISLGISDVEHLFMWLLAICISSFKKVYQVFCSFLNWVVWLFDIELYKLFLYFGN